MMVCTRNTAERLGVASTGGQHGQAQVENGMIAVTVAGRRGPVTVQVGRIRFNATAPTPARDRHHPEARRWQPSTN
jgi:hypothetical protein